MEDRTRTAEELKSIVREKYAEIVTADSSCCGSSCCGMESAELDYSTFSEDYTRLPGYNADADLKLGCGVPTEHAKIKAGDTVVDLGSGAGNDAFVARTLVGEEGKVIGIDMTDAMVIKARKNAEKLGAKNVEFRLGEIEKIPLPDSVADVVVSNCVMNLVPDKLKAFQETFRILKSGGHFSISDIVLTEELPEKLKNVATMYAGCVSGAVLKNHYLQTISEAGFRNIHIQAEKPIALPTEVLTKYLNDEELAWYKFKEPVVLSVTVYGQKEGALS